MRRLVIGFFAAGKGHEGGAAMKKLVLGTFPVTVAVVLAVLGALLYIGGSDSTLAGHGNAAGQVDYIAIDMDPTGNVDGPANGGPPGTPASSLGSREACISVSAQPGSVADPTDSGAIIHTIEVTLDDITGNPALLGYAFTLFFDPNKVLVVGANDLMMVDDAFLSGNQSGAYFTGTDGPVGLIFPDSSGDFRVNKQDLGNSTAGDVFESGAGPLASIDLFPVPGFTGYIPLELGVDGSPSTGNIQIKVFTGIPGTGPGPVWTVQTGEIKNVFDGVLAVGVPCPTNANLAIVSQVISPDPVFATPSENDEIIVQKVIENEGPQDNVAAIIWNTAMIPEDCQLIYTHTLGNVSLTPGGDIPLANIEVTVNGDPVILDPDESLPVNFPDLFDLHFEVPELTIGVPVTVDETFDVQCAVTSGHTFMKWNEIMPLPVDPPTLVWENNEDGSASLFGTGNCSDGSSNGDNDILIDSNDPECNQTYESIENGSFALTGLGDCADSKDNDGDTLVDTANDPECGSVPPTIPASLGGGPPGTNPTTSTIIPDFDLSNNQFHTDVDVIVEIVADLGLTQTVAAEGGAFSGWNSEDTELGPVLEKKDLQNIVIDKTLTNGGILDVDATVWTDITPPAAGDCKIIYTHSTGSIIITPGGPIAFGDVEVTINNVPQVLSENDVVTVSSGDKLDLHFAVTVPTAGSVQVEEFLQIKCLEPGAGGTGNRTWQVFNMVESEDDHVDEPVEDVNANDDTDNLTIPVIEPFVQTFTATIDSEDASPGETATLPSDISNDVCLIPNDCETEVDENISADPFASVAIVTIPKPAFSIAGEITANGGLVIGRFQGDIKTSTDCVSVTPGPNTFNVILRDATVNQATATAGDAALFSTGLWPSDLNSAPIDNQTRTIQDAINVGDLHARYVATSGITVDTATGGSPTSVPVNIVVIDDSVSGDYLQVRIVGDPSLGGGTVSDWVGVTNACSGVMNTDIQGTVGGGQSRVCNEDTPSPHIIDIEYIRDDTGGSVFDSDGVVCQPGNVSVEMTKDEFIGDGDPTEDIIHQGLPSQYVVLVSTTGPDDTDLVMSITGPVECDPRWVDPAGASTSILNGLQISVLTLDNIGTVTDFAITYQVTCDPAAAYGIQIIANVTSEAVPTDDTPEDNQAENQVAVEVTCDVDEDTICTPTDNCPNVANFNQNDADNDGEGNACDEDDDDDTIGDGNDDCTPGIPGPDLDHTDIPDLSVWQEDFDGVDDGDGCPDTDTSLTVDKEEAYDINTSEATEKTVTITVTNGNFPADVKVTALALSRLGKCEVSMIPAIGDTALEFTTDELTLLSGGPPDYNDTSDGIDDTFWSQIEWVEAGMAAGESRDVVRTYTIHCFQRSDQLWWDSTGDFAFDSTFELAIDVLPTGNVKEQTKFSPAIPAAGVCTALVTAPDVIQDTVDAAVGPLTICLAGEFHQSVSVSKDGLTFQQYPLGAPAVLDGDGPADAGATLGVDAFTIEDGVDNITIRDLEIRDYADPSLSPGTGEGNAVMAWDRNTTNVNIWNNNMHDFSWNALLIGSQIASKSHSNYSVLGNNISGAGWIGVELTNTSDSVVDGNTISNTGAFSGPSLAYGILLQVRNRAGEGGSGDRVMSNVTVTNNTVTSVGPADKERGIYLLAFTAGGGETATLNNVTVGPSNSFNNNNSDGIFILANDSGSTIDGVDIVGNDLFANERGIRTLLGGLGGETVTNITALNNNIVGNTSGVINDAGASSMNAENNWWGAADGPSTVGPGSGDTVSSNVDFDPFLGQPFNHGSIANNVHKNYPVVEAFDQADLKVVSTTPELIYDNDGDTTPDSPLPAGIPSGDAFDDDGDCLGTGGTPNPVGNPAIGTVVPHPVFPGALLCFDGTTLTGGVDEDPVNGLDDDKDGNEDGTSAPAGTGNCNDGVSNGDNDTLIDGADPDCAPFIDEDGGTFIPVLVDKVLHNNGPTSPAPAELAVSATVVTVNGTDCIVLIAFPDPNPLPLGSLPASVAVTLPGGTIPSPEVFNILCGDPAGADEDDDGDGSVDEDPIDGTDNDGDTLIDEDSGFDLGTLVVTNCIDGTNVHISDPNPDNNCQIVPIGPVPIFRNFEVDFLATHDEGASPGDTGTADVFPFGTPPLDDDCPVGVACEQNLLFHVGGGDPLAGAILYVPFDFTITPGTFVPNGLVSAHIESLVFLKVGVLCASPLPNSLDLVDAALPADNGGFSEGPNVPNFSGTSTGGNAGTTLWDTTASWPPGDLVGGEVEIEDGQLAIIVGNTANRLDIDMDPAPWNPDITQQAWTTPPPAGSGYEISMARAVNVYPTTLDDSTFVTPFRDFGFPMIARYVGVVPTLDIEVNVLVFADPFGISQVFPLIGAPTPAAAPKGFAHNSVVGDPNLPSGIIACTPFNVETNYLGETQIPLIDVTGDTTPDIPLPLRRCNQEALNSTVTYEGVFIRADLLGMTILDDDGECSGGLADVKDLGLSTTDEIAATASINEVLVTAGAPSTAFGPEILPATKNFPLDDTVHNNGPFSPVDVDITKSYTYGDPDCLISPSTSTVSATLEASVTTVVEQTWEVDWLNETKPPFYCDTTFSKTTTITTESVVDFNPGNNNDTLDIRFVRDADGDGVADCYEPGDPTCSGTPLVEDNCQDVVNPNQTDTDSDGIGDACDETPDHDVGIKERNFVILGPAAVNLSDTNGRYMWIVEEIGNFRDHIEAVEIGLQLDHSDLASCTITDAADALILPGQTNFLMLGLEQKFVVWRVRIECHEVTPGVYDLDITLTIDTTDPDHPDTVDPTVDPLAANNTVEVTRQVIIE